MLQKNTILQLARYVVSGGSGLVSYLAFLYLLTEFFHVYHLISFVIACIIGVLVNFALSKKFVFKSTKGAREEIHKFFTVAITGCIFQFGLVYLFAEIFKMQYFIANILAAGSIFIFTFTLNKIFTFKTTHDLS